MVIGLCGFGYSGSGAVYDLLREYSGMTITKDCEMSFLYRPDGITDLQYHLFHPARFFSSDYAIKRFNNKIHKFFRNHPEVWGLKDYNEIYNLTDSYLDSLTDVKWRGWWSQDASYMDGASFLIYRLLNKLTEPFPALNIKMQRKFYYRDMYLSVCPNDFLEKTQKYLVDLYAILGYDIEKDTVILNQAFSSDNPTASSIYYKNAKAIVVDKDPRDLYLLLKRESFKDCAWTPTDKVMNFIRYYQLMRREYKDIDKEKDLLIKMEDLIYEYETSITKIENYLGIEKSRHIHPLKFFDPKKSINNTQLFRKYPDMKKDIDLIEKELEVYLYDFDKYPIKTSFGKAF